MLIRALQWINALLAISAYVLAFFALSCYVFLLAPIKFMVPIVAWQAFFTRRYRQVPALFGHINTVILHLFAQITWQIKIIGNFDRKASYITLANHRSWMDIAVIQKILTPLTPPPVYFVKRQLLWVPFAGFACWLLGFPFMRRYSKAYLAKHPHKQGQDMLATQKMCQRYRDFPITLVSFVESTRFTTKKHALQQSSYQHLLNPRAGGTAFALQAMGEHVTAFIDLTIVYGQSRFSLWDTLCRRPQKITVRVEKLPIPTALRGNYLQDPQAKQAFYDWLNQQWRQKDQAIEALINAR